MTGEDAGEARARQAVNRIQRGKILYIGGPTFSERYR